MDAPTSIRRVWHTLASFIEHPEYYHSIINCLCREKKTIKLLPHRTDYSTSTTAETSDHTNTTDHSDVPPDTPDQRISSTVQPLSQDRPIEECISTLTIDEHVVTSSDTLSNDTAVSRNRDDIAPPSKHSIIIMIHVI